VSRVAKRGGERFISPAVQREAIQQWASRRGVKLAVVFEELDVPGAGADRPLLEQAIARIESRASSGWWSIA
jgi:DNA invertase Pin-like site-specific DNA recombinase